MRWPDSSQNHTAPSFDRASPYGPPRVSYSRIAPVAGSSLPMRSPLCSVNQSVPSAAWMTVCGPLPLCRV